MSWTFSGTPRALLAGLGLLTLTGSGCDLFGGGNSINGVWEARDAGEDGFLVLDDDRIAVYFEAEEFDGPDEGDACYVTLEGTLDDRGDDEYRIRFDDLESQTVEITRDDDRLTVRNDGDTFRYDRADEKERDFRPICSFNDDDDVRPAGDVAGRLFR